MRYLTFALGKGRLAKHTLELFEKIGITCEEMKDESSRKLIFTNEELKLRQYFLRVKKEPYGYSALTDQKQFYIENYPKVVIENSGIDDMITMMIRGERV